MLFDTHHHHPERLCGIYNLSLWETPTDAYFSVGLHPADITQDNTQALEWVAQMTKHTRCVAVGECGLDGLVPIAEALQKQVFETQKHWAESLQKPLILHCVKRHYELAKLCENLKVPVVFHGFNKNKTIAEMLVSKGFYLSFGVGLLRNKGLQQTFATLPLERIVLETDTADFDVLSLYQKVAELKALSLQEVEERLNQNLRHIFNIPI